MEASSYPGDSLLVTVATGFARELLFRADLCHDSCQANTVFDAWVFLTNNKREHSGDSSDEFPTELVVTLESLICSYLSNGSLASAQVFASSLRLAPQIIIERVFFTRALDKQDKHRDMCLLERFLDCDPGRFKVPFIKCLTGMKKNYELWQLFVAGLFDDAVHAILSRGDWPAHLHEEGQRIVAHMIDRALVVLSKMVSHQLCDCSIS
jgi:hypothetical protein